MAETAPNPIEKRLGIIAERWEEFRAEDEPRLLRWLGDADDASLLNAFLELETDEAGGLPDLFLRMENPFLKPEAYGFVLVEALKQRYEEMRPHAAEIGIDAAWICPAPLPGESGVQALAKACASFQAHYAALLDTLVLALFPAQVSDAREWMKWLYALARAPELPPEVRAMVLDEARRPRLDPLCQAEPKRIATRSLDLDLPGAMNETAANADDGSPGARFRKHYVALSTAAAKGDIEGAGKQAGEALVLAEREGWPQMRVVVHMALGAALASASRFDSALGSYGEAEKAAAAAQEAGDPVAGKLRVQAKLSAGSALIAAGRFPEAGKAYEETAPLAAAEGDVRFELESWRMAAYCREAGKDWEGAWNLNAKAFQAGEKMKPEDREASTLPYVGQALTRLHNKLGKTDGAALKQRLDTALGPGWEKKLERGASAS